MADALVSRYGQLGAQYTKPILVGGLVVATDATTRPENAPMLTASAGAAAAAQPAGSWHINTATGVHTHRIGAAWDTSAYLGQAQSWTAIQTFSVAPVLTLGASSIGGPLTWAAGVSSVLDVSACATGEADIVIADNLASALQVREAANAYLTFVTTNGSEAVALGQRLTTTDGVASGTARIVGGKVLSAVADSTTITNTTTETIFSTGTATLPANTLKAGTVVHVRFAGIVPSTNAADTLTIKVRIGGVGGTIVLQSAAVDVADNDVFSGEADIVCRTAGSGGTLVGGGNIGIGAVSVGTELTYVRDSTAVDTTAAQVVCVTADWSAASTANQVHLTYCNITVTG